MIQTLGNADLSSRAHTQRSSTTRLRAPWMWEAVYSTLGFDGAFSRTHWRKAAYVRAVWKGNEVLLMSRKITLLTRSCSLSPTRARSPAIDGSTLASDHTSARTQIAKRLLPAEPHLLDTKITTLALSRNRKLRPQQLSQEELQWRISAPEDRMMRTTPVTASRLCRSTPTGWLRHRQQLV